MTLLACKDLKQTKAVFFDFDGVFTDNIVYVDQTGKESVACWRSDGLGLVKLKSINFPIYVLSTEKNPVVAMRCKKLGVACFNGLDNKSEKLAELAMDLGIELEQVAYLGNDINDLSCLKKVGIPIVVADAHSDVVFEGVFRTSKTGGRGAVREVCDLIYKSIAYGGKND